MKELLKEIEDRELNLLQQRADANFWCFIKIIKIDAQIKTLQILINHIKKFYVTK